jgi:hypothetical protein
MIGELDEVVLSLQKVPEMEKVDSAKAKLILEEIRKMVQISMTWPDDNRAQSVLETGVFDDDFEALAKQPEKAEEYRKILRRKLDLAKTLVSPAMLERAKRLSTSIGAVLEDVDIELINQRNSNFDQILIASPFLRLKFRYSDSAASRLPFYFGGFLGSAPSEGRAFELECDETDIDLLVGRLLKAKELLSSAIEPSAPSKEDTKTTK